MEFDLIDHIEGKSKDHTAIWLFNIGVEKYWNNDSGFIKDIRGDKVVNHVEEMMLLLAPKGDYVILRKKPSDYYLNRIKVIKEEIANIICLDNTDEDKSVTELILESDNVLSQIEEIKRNNENTILVPYGISKNEEKLAQICKLKFVGSSSELSKKINNKILARQISKELGFSNTDGTLCESFDEIQKTGSRLLTEYNKIIIKSPTNASGKGMWIVENEKEFSTVLKIVKRFMKKNPDMKWLVEGWIDNKKDINYQIYISESGDVKVFSVKEQILEGVVYIGSYIPPRINKETIERFVEYGEKLGAFLYKKGYRGVFGIDALIDGTGKVIPILEINGRFTLSTYISMIEKTVGEHSVYSYYINVNSNKKVNYQALDRELKSNDILFDGERGSMCYIESTADAGLAEGYCRLFMLSVGDDDKKLSEYHQKTETIINKLYIDER